MRLARLLAVVVVLGWLALSIDPSPLSSAPSGSGPFDSSVLRKIEPQLLKELEAAKDGRVDYVVQFAGKADLSSASRQPDKVVRRKETVAALKSAAQRSQKTAIQDTEGKRLKGQVESYSSLWIINGLSVKGDKDSVFALAANPQVESIRFDHRRYLNSPTASAPAEQAGTLESEISSPNAIEWNISKIRADTVWSALGIDGTGVVVASLDTGVDWQHPWLIDNYRGNLGRDLPNHNGNWYDFTPEAFQYPADLYGHGTHVTGIMVGSDDSDRGGVAPGATWIAARVFSGSSNPYADDSWIHKAFQWILAPGDPISGGDPSLAPDVVNCSWGSSNAWDEFFQPDIVALLAADIIPVFAAGNDGPSPQTINSPGSLDMAFSVGATDSSDKIAGFSGRGPSPWGKVKPEISAPGVNIFSSFPGGSRVSMSGTSMATPHIAGVLALLRQANPGVSAVQAFNLLTSTSVALGANRPNNDYGWGRVDAYAAVSQALQAGSLVGSISDERGNPVSGATVTAINDMTGAHVIATSGQDGRYSLALASGLYDVTAAHFGYSPSAPVKVSVALNTVLTKNISLVSLSVGTLIGHVVEAGTGIPLVARITVLGTPVGLQTDSTGVFTLTLPAGAYDVRASSDKHRTQTRVGTVSAGGVTDLSYSLATAPSILLVDSGTWYGQSEIAYLSSGLDRLDYLYAVRPITDTRLLPSSAELAAYDIVIWSSPLDSPGYIGADVVLSNYMDRGGKLLLTGQDVGYYDGGGSALVYAPYFRDHLYASFVSDNSGVNSLVGSADGPFAGITLTLNTADSAGNQSTPDVVAALGPRSSNVFDYNRDGNGGIETDVCLPYRVIYLGFGLEGAGPASNRAELLGRAIDWLVAPSPQRQVRVLPPIQSAIQEPGKVVTATLQVWNTGSLSDRLTLAVTHSGWPATLWDESFTSLLPGAVNLTSCEAITVGVRIEVPSGVGKNASSTSLVSASSQSLPSVSAAGAINAKSPAYILLVDADRFYDTEYRYKTALFDNGFPYDVYDTQGGQGPSLASLKMYSMTVWFTGYDWYRPVSDQDQANLTTYLSGGGRLFLSSQDYLYVHDLSSFTIQHLGVLSYTNDVTATLVRGTGGDIVGDGLGPFTLTLPYVGFRDWSDEVVPKAPAVTSMLDINGLPTGISSLDGSLPGRSVFFAFPFEGLDAGPAKEVMERIVERALGTDLKVDKRTIKPGGELRFELSIVNVTNTAANWSISSPLPPLTAFVPGSLEGGAVNDPVGRRILWQGAIAPGEVKRIAYRVRVDDAALGSVIGSATFDLAGKGAFRRQSTTLVTPYVFFMPVVLVGQVPGG